MLNDLGTASLNIRRMTKRKYTLLYYIGSALLLLTTLTACEQDTVYYHYEHTPLTGWERNDTMVFQTAAVMHAGVYQEEVGMRISEHFPFTGIDLIIEQTILPAYKTHCDTIHLTLIDQQGYVQGQGISQFQYLQPLTTLELSEGDHLRIAVRHDMKREIIPGISEVGIKVRRK